MRFSNLHQHSNFSDGKNSMEEVISCAIANDMESIGFSDHATPPFEPFKGVNNGNLTEYFNAISLLKNIYANKITIFKGLEVDSFSDIKTGECDYVIGSVHYVKNKNCYHPVDYTKRLQTESIQSSFNGNKLLYAECYFNEVVRCIERTKPDIIGHFDLINKFSLFNEEDPIYKSIAKNALEECFKYCKLVEINTGAISRGYRKTPYPATFLLEKILADNGDVILSADSHAKDTICFHFENCVALLKEIGFKRIVKLTENGFVKEKI